MLGPNGLTMLPPCGQSAHNMAPADALHEFRKHFGPFANSHHMEGGGSPQKWWLPTFEEAAGSDPPLLSGLQELKQGGACVGL